MCIRDRAEDVAREDVAAPPITDANMVPGVPGGIQTKKLPASKIDPRAVRRENDSLFVDRQDLPITANNFGRPVHLSLIHIWNAAPRNEKDEPGAYEACLAGTPVAIPDQPLEVLRTVHSFCLLYTSRCV